MSDDAERLRIADADFGIALARRLSSPGGEVPDVVCLVTTGGSFPTVAGRYYKVQPQLVLGTEAENQSGSFTAGTGEFYALNIGPNVPVNGTSKVVCSHVPHRWVFEY